MEKDKLLSYIGNISQTGYCRHYTLNEGWGRGMRASDINTGSGLQYTVLPDRGLDISLASFKGVNLVYLTCNGETHPAFYEPEGLGWLHTFAGGLLTTCGLTHFGAPCIDNDEHLGLHGRISTIPVKQFADLSDWDGNDYNFKVRGIIEEGYLFGKKLRMVREISSKQGQNMIRIKDVITNFGSKPSPYNILYHMNFGYPLLDENAELVIDSAETIPRDQEAINGITNFRTFIKPQQEYKEQVFFHKLNSGSNGVSTVILRNKKIGTSVSISLNVKELPYVTQWKMMGYGEYVLGIEPCNVPCKSRDMLREEKMLPMLKPDESKTNILEISVNDI
jgi:hypothetical protein